MASNPAEQAHLEDLVRGSLTCAVPNMVFFLTLHELVDLEARYEQRQRLITELRLVVWLQQTLDPDGLTLPGLAAGGVGETLARMVL